MEKLPGRAALAAVLALLVGGALGLSCGSDSSSEATTSAPTSRQERTNPKHSSALPPEGGATTTEKSP